MLSLLSIQHWPGLRLLPGLCKLPLLLQILMLDIGTQMATLKEFQALVSQNKELDIERQSASEARKNVLPREEADQTQELL